MTFNQYLDRAVRTRRGKCWEQLYWAIVASTDKESGVEVSTWDFYKTVKELDLAELKARDAKWIVVCFRQFKLNEQLTDKSITPDLYTVESFVEKLRGKSPECDVEIDAFLGRAAPVRVLALHECNDPCPDERD